jgi:hypothetical protein
LLLARAVTGTGSIQANGNAGQNTAGIDGSGGGGAGGSIVVSAASQVSGITMQANGGQGGSQTSTAVGAEGPGGGGGGGLIAVSAPTMTGVTRTANGGANGTTASSALTEFTPNGATRGGAGRNNAAAPTIPGRCLATQAVGPGCPSGMAPTGLNFVANGDFAVLAGPGPGVAPAAQFTSGVTNNGNDTCPTETGISTWSGASTCTFAVQQPFPGDSTYGFPATNFLMGNGNNTGSPYRLWQQAVSGLLVGQTYEFSVYASSALTPGPTCGCTATPAVQFRVDGSPLGPGMDVPIEPVAAGDVWQRHQATFTATAASATLAIFDTNLGSLGGDLALTQIGLRVCGAPTAVRLASFEAREAEGSVELRWRTSSELDNLGFHVYRATSEAGPYTRLTSSLIPGLGSSPEGASYTYRDRSIAAEAVYYYKLEDVETTGASRMHGPITASARAAAPPAAGEGEALASLTFGSPGSNRFRILRQDGRGLSVELSTEGFSAEPLPDGTVRLSIGDFDVRSDGGAVSIPVRRIWLDAAAGRTARLSSIEEGEVLRFSSLRPSGAEVATLEATRYGVVRAARRVTAAKREARAVFPSERARIVGTGFQGESKRLELELAPLSWDPIAGKLRLVRRLVVHIAFSGGGAIEPARTSRRTRTETLAQLATSERGLHSVSYERLFAGRTPRSFPASSLRLARLGEPIAFHVEPDTSRFGPGSRLYFLAPGTRANPYGSETVFELSLEGAGLRMSQAGAPPAGPEISFYRERFEGEENRLYQAALVDAPDLWFWDALFAPVTKAYPFEVEDLSSGEPAGLRVRLSGASDFPGVQDHHVRLYVNGTLVSEAAWDGKASRGLEVELGAGLLLEGANRLEIENVGDTAALYSMVLLDRFEVDYPRTPRARKGRLEGTVLGSGTLLIAAMGERSMAIDVTDEKHPAWLREAVRSADGSLRFRAEDGHRYLAASSDALIEPVIIRPTPVPLDHAYKADYVAIAPQAFLASLEPLLQQRRRQGLRTRSVAIEDINREFGFGEATPLALREFLRDLYSAGRLRYVLLAGDATYDFKDYLGTGVRNQVPPLMIRTSYLWTASDPALASVHGDDALPDLAVGRLPAASTAELAVMVGKILDYESKARVPSSRIVLVADNSDSAGDFDRDLDRLEAGVLRGRNLETIRLSRLGVSESRRRIAQSFDDGASLVSYVGHGGIHVWAEENLLDLEAVGRLSPQRENPLLLTMNCLNGYFHFPYFNSLAEELLKRSDRGIVAAFSPTGMSLDAHAHVLQELLLDAVLHGGHERLGDAVLAAQRDFAAAGGSTELLAIYHLLGDPALELR